MKLILEGERPMSWNTLYAGKFWSVRKEEAERVHLTVLGELEPDSLLYQNRVDIIITTYFDKRPYDSCNIPMKLYIDGLAGRLIIDDDIKYVRSSKSIVEIDRQRPRVEIDIIDTGQPVWKKLPQSGKP
jgi:hypothetical protein